MNNLTQSGLQRRIAPRPPDGAGSYGVHVSPTHVFTTWPPGIGRFYRPVVLTEAHGHPHGIYYGHRRRDGSHYNVPINRVCRDCVVEAELEYLQALWRATYTGKRPPP